MSKLNCNVVQDILPLYADEVVCEDTKALVEEHLEECDGCRQELFAMKVQVELPTAPDAAEAMKKVTRKWGNRQLWKGIGITAAIAALLIGGFFYLYGYGLPVKAEDVTLHAGLQCETKRDRLTGEYVPTGEQVWIVDIGTLDGRAITTSDWAFEEVKDGFTAGAGVRIYVRRSPFLFPWDHGGSVRHGMASSGDTEYSWTEDFTITVVCADREIVYSMNEEGLWDKTQKHTAEFCHMVGRGCPYDGND